MKRPSQIYPMVEVWWNDATELPSGWIEAKEDFEITPCIVLSVGFLVKETDEFVIVAIDTHNGGHNGRSQIPKAMVKKMRVIRKPDQPKSPPAAKEPAKPEA
jgi:hypothetical protein